MATDVNYGGYYVFNGVPVDAAILGNLTDCAAVRCGGCLEGFFRTIVVPNKCSFFGKGGILAYFEKVMLMHEGGTGRCVVFELLPFSVCVRLTRTGVPVPVTVTSIRWD
jgi:hypothetical protein